MSLTLSFGPNPVGLAQAITNRPSVFEHSNFEGRRAFLSEGEYADVSNIRNVDNDSISSIKVPDGWKVTVFVDTKLTGESHTFTSNVTHLSEHGLNDRISSIKVEKICPPSCCRSPTPCGSGSSTSASFDLGSVSWIMFGARSRGPRG
ncbi:hypothetical protein ACFWGL_39160 [Streptomyces sp. NPDC060286]|uniref:hypothetical protein n=1 Tax=unclassified Streptomyces TaxID=2593676 RepID=UPI0035D65AD3